MDFRFTPQEEAFRQEVRDFIRREMPPDLGEGIGLEAAFEPGIWPTVQELRKKLAARNWLAISWPKEYGGMGESLIKQAIFREEMEYWRCPAIDPQAYQLGPAIIVHGTEEQKKRFLGGIARAEDTWCQGFSEPNAGSDLANIQTRAVQNGDDFLINGQKIWTSGAHLADYIHMLARTDPAAPKHRGISYFLFSMKLPGITVRPINQMDGGMGFNEVFFDNVRVPKEALFGELNRGWYVATTTLDFERANVAIVRSAAGRRALDDLVEFCVKNGFNGRPPLATVTLRHRAAELAIETEVARMLSYRVLWMQNSGKVPNAEASLAKVSAYENYFKVAWLAMEVLGLYGQLSPQTGRAPLNGRVYWTYLRSACRVGGGSPEIQRNIIAQRGLGLPR